MLTSKYQALCSDCLEENAYGEWTGCNVRTELRREAKTRAQPMPGAAAPKQGYPAGPSEA